MFSFLMVPKHIWTHKPRLKMLEYIIAIDYKIFNQKTFYAVNDKTVDVLFKIKAKNIWTLSCYQMLVKYVHRSTVPI